MVGARGAVSAAADATVGHYHAIRFEIKTSTTFPAHQYIFDVHNHGLLIKLRSATALLDFGQSQPMHQVAWGLLAVPGVTVPVESDCDSRGLTYPGSHDQLRWMREAVLPMPAPHKKTKRSNRAASAAAADKQQKLLALATNLPRCEGAEEQLTVAEQHSALGRESMYHAVFDENALPQPWRACLDDMHVRPVAL